jgi:hypothetical protein
MSSYGPFDGVPAGEYQVTVNFDGRYGPVGDRKSWVPLRYTKADTTPLVGTVKAGKNELIFNFKAAPDDEPKAAPKK